MPPKRKRDSRSSVDLGETRPSPHRPGTTALGQHNHGSDMREAGSRRSSRGGQGGGRIRRNDRPNFSNVNQLNSSTGVAAPERRSPPPRSISAAQPSSPVTAIKAPPLRGSGRSPFEYTFITGSYLASWDTYGRRNVVDKGIKARQDEDIMDLSGIFQECIRAALDRCLNAVEAGACVREIIGNGTIPSNSSMGTTDFQGLFLDTLSMLCEAEEIKHPQDREILRRFAVSTAVPAVVMRQTLDSSLLELLQLTRSTFVRVGIRKNTALLYRQANYNLLREESEGYSKLVTELFSMSEGGSAYFDVVEDAFEKIKGLIGTFDLDVGRVLDITLDVFASLLIKYYRFFVKLLRVSSWWPRKRTENASSSQIGGLPRWALPASAKPLAFAEDGDLSKEQKLRRDIAFWDRAREVGIEAFFELGGRVVVKEKVKKNTTRADSDMELDADNQWIQTTGTLPPSGNRIAAQLLGFKLRFYASEARHNEDILPDNLIYLTALLIKIGFISLKDLYPHIWPLDEGMEELKEEKQSELEKEQATKTGGAPNALMRAGALPDDDPPPLSRTRDLLQATTDATPKPITEVDNKEQLNPPLEQKVRLLKSLLTIGAVPESLFMLSRFPWLPEVYTELYEYIHRILNYSLQKVYESCHLSKPNDDPRISKKVVDLDQSGMPKGSLRLIQMTPRSQLRWPFPDKFDTNENKNYKFYWDEWADNIPVCQNFDDVFTLCGSFLNLSAVNIGRDVVLLSKLARIGTTSLYKDSSKRNLDRWQDLLKRLLVPALSLTTANTNATNEIYDMLRFYPISIRYNIYAEWFEGQTSRLPVMKLAFDRTKQETLRTMKRISTTNVSAMARTLAKVAYASPGIVFSVALTQIEAYTNLTEVVVECAKYFTDLGYDVLVWSLMTSLGGKDRNRNNAEFALLPSRWLLALSRFSGKVFRRYSIMNPLPILQYVNHQLHAGNSTDLVILQELITQMAGMVADTDFNDSQRTALTGGVILRKQTLTNLGDTRYQSTKTAKRLMRALTESNLAGQLLLSIAQHRQSAIYKIPDEDAHIKLLATIVDDTHSILTQYLDLLRSNLSVEDFDNYVPSIPELLTAFGLDPPLAFMIGRASVAQRWTQLLPSRVNGSLKGTSAQKIDGDGDVGMKDADKQAGDAVEITATSNGDQSPIDEKHMDDTKESEIPAATAEYFHTILEPIITTVELRMPEGYWKSISPEFYVTFWTSTLSDISIPKQSYDVEISRLLKEQENVMRDRADMTKYGTEKKEEIRKSIEATRKLLVSEFSEQVRQFPERKARLLKRKSIWFENFKEVKADELSDSILERCLLPRALLSPSEVDFCYKMVKFMHDNGTPHFRTLSMFSRIFRPHRLRSIIFTCTVREAENLGRLLRHILKDLARWHGSRALYEKEALGSKKELVGFAKTVDEDGRPKALLEHDGKVGFKNILLSWHKALNGALRECLEGTEWMHIRNAITVLKAVAETFPVVDFMGNNLIKQLETVAKREKDLREDLSLTANAVLVQLKQRSKSWVMVQAFGYNITNGSPAKQAAQLASTETKTILKPTAPEFIPQSLISSVQALPPKASMEVEDGEVDDSRKPSIVDEDHTTPMASITNDLISSTAALPFTEPKTPDIPTQREQAKNDSATRSALQSSAASNTMPSRPELSRALSSHHSLPNRPDAPIPRLKRYEPARYEERRDNIDPRPMEWSRDRHREMISDRRPVPSSRDFGRPSERIDPPPPRWTNESVNRDHNERAPSSGNRGPDMTGRLSREGPMPPPRQSERPFFSSTDRSPPINSNRHELINPERAVRFVGNDSHSNSPRSFKDGHGDCSIRAQSPIPSRRSGLAIEIAEPKRDDRFPRNDPGEFHVTTQGDDIQPPPLGPRNDGPGHRSTERSSERRDSSNSSTFTPSHPLQRDPDHGRLNAYPRQPDPNYGRLNAAPSAPSGPRERSLRGGRMASAPQTRRDNRLPEAPRAPTPEKQPPTAPASDRTRRTPGQTPENIATGTGVPSTPASTTPSPSVHPDRLKHLQTTATQPMQSSQPIHFDQTPSASTPTLPSIHPERLGAFENDHTHKPNMPPQLTPPIPLQHTVHGRLRSENPSAMPSPPSGPKGSAAPWKNSIATPTGPASAFDRSARGRGQVKEEINSVLKGSMDTGVAQERGRGRRNTGQPDTPLSGTSTPILPPLPPHGTGKTDYNPKDLINPERAELIDTSVSDERSRGPWYKNSVPDRGHRSRRSSKSPERRDSKRAGGFEEDLTQRKKHRDRHAFERGFERGPRGSLQHAGPPQGVHDGREIGGNVWDGREWHGRGWEYGDGGRGHLQPGWGGGNNWNAGNREPRGEGDRRKTRGPREDGGRKREVERDEGDDTHRKKRPR